ncbi:hypothetical protein [Pedobacter sp. SL55]|uniref:hypothetical protein n=1 Tax=Pedobacter sp. SL55 TaxID=2995161 RepID=UPI00226D8BE7|nr:hypothetical protein [Pedobacter sp. SL55]WAC42583.1 hypothetical protein OVA16_09575 [Pedobacter sp. SL55]
MKKLKAIFFRDVDQNQLFSTLQKLMLINFVSSFLALIDGGAVFFIPIIIGSFIVYQFYEEKQRIKFVVYFLPFIFLFIFFTGGGGFFIIQWFETYGLEDYKQLFVGVWSAYIVLLCIWMLFKVKIKIIHVVLLSTLIPIPYLLGLNGINEHVSGFFFFFYGMLCFLWY